MELNEAKAILKQNGYILEEFDVFGKEPVFYPNKKKNKNDVVDVYKKIMELDETDDWEVDEEETYNFFTLDELTNGTLEKVAQRNKGHYTVILAARKELNQFNDFVEIELCLSPKGFPVIQVSANDGKEEKLFDITEFKVALKYANKIYR